MSAVTSAVGTGKVRSPATPQPQDATAEQQVDGGDFLYDWVERFRLAVRWQLDWSYVFPYASCMKTMTSSAARANLYRLLEETVESSEPVQITSKKGNSVLVSEEDWRALQETVHLLSIPGMRESIREGLATPIDECSEDPGW